MPLHFENGEKYDGSKILASFTRYWNNLKIIGNLMVKNCLQDFDAKEMYLHSKGQFPVSGISRAGGI